MTSSSRSTPDSVELPGSLSGNIVLEMEPGVATVNLVNPGKRNALNVKMWNALTQVFQSLAIRPELRCVVVQGASEEGFAAGADISEFDQVRRTREQVEHFHEQVVLVALKSIFDCPVPVIASISGACVGGGLEIASVCDLRIATRGARFGAPVNILGFPLAPAELQWLYHLVGPTLTAQMIFEGAILSAEEAWVKGLLTHIVDDEDLQEATRDCVQRIVLGAPLAARANKRHLRHLMEHGGFNREQRLESYSFADTEDYQIGIQAFRNKTRPVFKGR